MQALPICYSFLHEIKVVHINGGETVILLRLLFHYCLPRKVWQGWVWEEMGAQVEDDLEKEYDLVQTSFVVSRNDE